MNEIKRDLINAGVEAFGIDVGEDYVAVSFDAMGEETDAKRALMATLDFDVTDKGLWINGRKA